MGNKTKSSGFHLNMSDNIIDKDNTEQRDKFIKTLKEQSNIAFSFVETFINVFSLTKINSYVLFNFLTGSELFLKSLILGQTDNVITFENANSTITKYKHNLSNLIEKINNENIIENKYRQFIITFTEIFKTLGYWHKLHNYPRLRYGLDVLDDGFFEDINLTVSEVIELGRKINEGSNR